MFGDLTLWEIIAMADLGLSILQLCFLIFQVPLLQTPDGPIFESNAITRYGNYYSMYYLGIGIDFSLQMS